MRNKLNMDVLKERATPFFFYDLELLDQTLDAIAKATQKRDFQLHYALKANANEPILKRIQERGIGADCVSGNEISKALAVGFTADQIAFAGVGKTDEEIRLGLKHDIFSFNCESLPELEVIDQLAKEQGKIAKVAIRFNPNVNAKTHHYITTGLEENKFGINRWELDQLLNLLERLEHIKLSGLHFHIGSQITDLTVFKSLCLRVNEINKWFLERGISIDHLNLGGGLGVNYNKPDAEAIPDFEAYFSIFETFLERQAGQSVHFELGRAVVAQCGSLISRLLYVKEGIKTNFAIIDAGMTELIRPALYQSFHRIENWSAAKDSEKVKYDVVGPICESSDCFGKAVELEASKRGDFIAIRSTGAYGEVMSSSYNLRDKAKAYYYEKD